MAWIEHVGHRRRRVPEVSLGTQFGPLGTGREPMTTLIVKNLLYVTFIKSLVGGVGVPAPIPHVLSHGHAIHRSHSTTIATPGAGGNSVCIPQSCF